MPVVLAYVVLVLGAIGALVHALLVDPTAATLFSPTVKAALGLVGIIVATLLPAIQSIAKAKVSGKPPSLPPLPVLFLLLVVLVMGCKGLTPGKLQNIENTVDTVALDACILAADFAPNEDAQTVAEVCDVVEKGIPVAEDVANYIAQQLEAKKRSKDPALKAKYSEKLAARKP